MTTSTISTNRARLYVLLAGLLWSLSGAFKTVLTQPTSLGLNEPLLDSNQIAFWRVLFAGLVLVPTLRTQDMRFRPALIGMVVTFALMNLMFMRALTQGTAANAIFLQYTAPAWVYLAGIYWLGEKPDRRSTASILMCLLGVGLIVLSGWNRDNLQVVGLALGSGVAYAGVLLWLRILRSESPSWLTVLNHLGSALILLPFAWPYTFPNGPQLAWLFLFGSLQMGLPYWLMARGLRSISPHEAGTLTLIEPVLNPIWALCISPNSENPGLATWVGGAIILSAIGYRYWPSSPRSS